MKRKSGNKFINSFRYAFSGLKASYKSEHNMRIHFLIAVLVIILGLFFNITQIEWIFVTLAIGLVISAEIINTGVEKLVDLVTTKYSEEARDAKDISAAFVLITSLVASVVGLIIFIPYVIDWIRYL